MFYKNTLIVIFKHQEVYFQTLESLKSACNVCSNNALSSSPFARNHYKQADTGWRESISLLYYISLSNMLLAYRILLLANQIMLIAKNRKN